MKNTKKKLQFLSIFSTLALPNSAIAAQEILYNKGSNPDDLTAQESAETSPESFTIYQKFSQQTDCYLELIISTICKMCNPSFKQKKLDNLGDLAIFYYETFYKIYQETQTLSTFKVDKLNAETHRIIEFLFPSGEKKDLSQIYTYTNAVEFLKSYLGALSSGSH